MQRSKLGKVLQSLGAGIGAGAALGFVNRAAHVSNWGQGFLCVATGLLAAWSAVRLVSKAGDDPGVFWNYLATSILTGALLLAATYLEGRTLWVGAAWLGAAGAGATLALELAAARWDKSLRLPQVCCLLALCVGVALARYSPWNAAIVGAAACLPPLALVLERRFPAAANGAGRDAADGVRSRSLSGYLWGSL